MWEDIKELCQNIKYVALLFYTTSFAVFTFLISLGGVGMFSFEESATF